MAKQKKETILEAAIAYRVIKNSCNHGGIDYLPGDLLPSGLSLAEINIHLPNCEIVEIERESVLTPENVVEIIDQESNVN